MLKIKYIKQLLFYVITSKFIGNFVVGFSLIFANCLVAPAAELTGEHRCVPSPKFNSGVPATTVEKTLVAITIEQNDFVNELEDLVHQQINQYRQSLNLSPLQLNPLISKQARIHSENMAQGIVPFGHNGFEERVKALEESIQYRRAAENVAYNQGYSDPVGQAVQGWINSFDHRHNIEGNYDLTGIGVAKNDRGEYYFTQLFILKR
ncbi:SCP-like extracellular [Stanieria sp. NIES-3757]|nr:SCP-like extracellular [Stanieria sp. NIES-3757]